MTRSAQRAEEIAAVNDYVAALEIECRVEEGPDPPDVVIIFKDGRRIGVEATRYLQRQDYNGYSLRQVEEACRDCNDYVNFFRQNNNLLGNLSVHLDLKRIVVPKRSEMPDFVESVTQIVETKRFCLSHRSLRIPITGAHAEILQCYLRTIWLRKVRSYIEWDWGIDFGGIGTSDEEMFCIFKDKEYFCCDTTYAENWLLIYGGVERSGIVDLSVRQICCFQKFNEALKNGHFDEVAVLGLKKIRWRRKSGWCEI